MRKFSSLFIVASCLLTMVLPVLFGACSSTSPKTADAPVTSGTYRARTLLSERQRRTYDSLFLEAQVQKLNGDLREAGRLLDSALVVNPNASEALYERAVMLLEYAVVDSVEMDSIDYDSPVADSPYADSIDFDALALDHVATIDSIGRDSLEMDSIALDSLPFDNFKGLDFSALLGMRRDSINEARGEELLVKAYQLEPKNTTIRDRLIQHWMEVGKHHRAARIYEDVVAEKPTEENLRWLRYLYVLGDRYQEALDAHTRLEKLVGVDQETVFQRVELLVGADNLDAAFEYLKEYCVDHPDSLKVNLLLSEYYLHYEQTEKAHALFRKLAAAHPGNPMLEVSRMKFLDNTPEAENQLAVILSHPQLDKEIKSRNLYHFMAQEMEEKRSKGSLMPMFHRALQTPQPTTDLAELALFYIDAMGLPKDSTVFPLQCILRDDPDYLRARVQLMLYESQRNNVPVVIELAEEGIRRHPDEMIFYYFSGMGYARIDNDAKALSLFQEGMRHISDEDDAGFVSELYAAAGDICHKLKRNAESFAYYDQALEKDPDNASCLNNYAYFLSVERKQLSKALSMSQRAVELRPEDATFLDTHAWVLFALKRYAEAQTTIDRALNIVAAEEASSHHATYFDHAGDIYFRCRQLKAAIAHWQKALELSDDDQMSAKLRKKIRNKRL